MVAPFYLRSHHCTVLVNCGLAGCGVYDIDMSQGLIANRCLYVTGHGLFDDTGWGCVLEPAAISSIIAEGKRSAGQG